MPKTLTLVLLLTICPTAFAQANQGDQCRDPLGNIIVNCTPSQAQPQVQPLPPQKPTKVNYGAGGETGTPKVMGVVGYSYESSSKLTASTDSGSIATPTRGFNGFFVQPTLNINDYLAVVGNVDGGYHGETVPDIFFGNSLDMQLWALSYTAGPQFYPMSHRYAWQPFAHVTLGAATALSNKSTETYLGLNTNHETAFAYQIGGGLDYRSENGRLGWRVGQIDYIHAKKSISGISGVEFIYTTVKFGVGVSF
jgi:Outer membrane protein beta-barrel domain